MKIDRAQEISGLEKTRLKSEKKEFQQIVLKMRLKIEV